MRDSYYDNPEKYSAVGVDYDLFACLDNNPQEGFNVGDIAKVLAVFEGENDGHDWHWILRLNDDRFIYLTGGCDYTGWDCQSSANHAVVSTPLEALSLVDEQGSWYNITREQIVSSLSKQLEEGKEKTWREGKDEEFGLKSVRETKESTGMTVAELIEYLKEMPADALVLLSSDGEGNSYSPFSGDHSEGVYVADSTWSGDFYGEDDTNAPRFPGAVKAVVLWPIN